jgi:hypothetical protein
VERRKAISQGRLLISQVLLALVSLHALLRRI